MAELKLRKCKAIILKSVFTGEACCVCVCVCVCVRRGKFQTSRTCGHRRGEGKEEYFLGHYKMPLVGVSKAV